MNCVCRPFLLFVCFIAATFTAVAQPSGSKQTDPVKPAAAPAKVAKDPDAERVARQRRSQARSLLIALSVDARTFRHQPLRARSLARIADTLWSVDSEQARTMFRKAWEAAEVADTESERRLQEDAAQQRAKTGGAYGFSLPPNLRREVLRLVSHHDTNLSEEFLEKLKTQKQEAAESISRSLDANSQRLGVARELLTSGDPERALQFVEPLLGRVTPEIINFLSYVREANPALADARYSAMLAQQAMNPQADANTVSLLSSYIFTPHLMITFSDRGGFNTSQATDKIEPAAVSPELRTAFLNTAAAILLRPIPPPGQEQGPASVDGKYLVIKRLLPFFEQFASPELSQSIRNQVEALNAVVSDGARRRDDEWMRRGVRPETPAEDREQQLLDRIDRAKTSAERDALYIQLAYNSFARDDLRARDFVSKIEDPELRNQLGAYVDGALAIHFVEKKQVERLLELASNGDLTHVVKAWILSYAARGLLKTDRQKALDVVEEAATEARRIDGSDADRPRALLAVANALNEIDPGRVWDATFDAVKAANSAEAFTGEDGIIVLKFSSKNQSSISDHNVAEFDVAGIFKTLADRDYERAVELARGFQGEGPRAVATIAIARAVLNPTKPATPPVKRPSGNL
ncbi:MAG TPA: hypothetical protein VL866_02905 [Pyrinomonadaceae bacterium]|nr:hypothetical protein [Pyrinomonadaceae bacterium]